TALHLVAEPIEAALVGVGDEVVADRSVAEHLPPGATVDERDDAPGGVLPQRRAEALVFEHDDPAVRLDLERRTADRSGRASRAVLCRIAEARKPSDEEAAALG